jgi:hypothetical protein
MAVHGYHLFGRQRYLNVYTATSIVDFLQPNVKKGAASKRCGCDPPTPEVAGLAPLHSLMDIFRRMCVIILFCFFLNEAKVCHFDDCKAQAHIVFQWPRLDSHS